MNGAISVARQFAQLVGLLVNEPANTDGQKVALRALVVAAKPLPVVLTMQGQQVLANGAPVPFAFPGMDDLAAQLIGHSVRALRFDAGPTPADVLGVARMLAKEAVPGDAGQALVGALAALGVATVTLTVGGDVGVGFATIEATLLTPEESFALAAGVPVTRPEAAAVAPVSPSATAAPAPAELQAFGAVLLPTGNAQQLLATLDAAQAPAAVSRALEELVVLAENAGREGALESVVDVFGGVVTREREVADGALRAPFAMALRRLSKPTLLRAVAQLLPRGRERADVCLAILQRAGEDGADALVEQLMTASAAAPRRVYFDALKTLNAGVPALVHMLGDARWHVVRNAADLLGEMAPAAADAPLAELLRHDDERVRRSVAGALARIATPRAAEALRVALSDAAPQVRLQAATALATRGGRDSGVALVAALDDEADAEVQLAILGALGRVATPDAVQRLIRAAETDGRLFKRKPVPLRVAAVNALGEARTPGALTALSTLLTDRDKDVRDAAVRAFRKGA